jgi:tRNA threonylcarbamoyladenosine biosynthesis protein TsaE
VVALVGSLGAGKTRLVQAVAQAAGVPSDIIASPTFVLVHEYQGRLPIFHFDVYRLRDEDEFLALGPEEYFSQPGWSFVEWADRVVDCLPPERIEISIEPVDPNIRRFSIRALGEKYQQTIESLKEALSQTRTTE